MFVTLLSEYILMLSGLHIKLLDEVSIQSVWILCLDFLYLSYLGFCFFISLQFLSNWVFTSSLICTSHEWVNWAKNNFFTGCWKNWRRHRRTRQSYRINEVGTYSYLGERYILHVLHCWSMTLSLKVGKQHWLWSHDIQLTVADPSCVIMYGFLWRL